MTHTDEPELDASLRKLNRSTGMFSYLLSLALALLLGTSVYTNVRVLQITQVQHRDGIALHHAISRLALDEARDRKKTTDARIASCKQSNIAQVHLADTLKADDHDFAARLDRAFGVNPDTDPALVTFDAEHGKVIDKRLPLRDCSPAGIAKFLNQKGP